MIENNNIDNNINNNIITQHVPETLIRFSTKKLFTSASLWYQLEVAEHLCGRITVIT